MLAEALAGAGPVVVSAAGGAVLAPENRALLAAHTVVWLRADPATLAARVGDGEGRPLLGGRPGRHPGRARRRPAPALRGGGRRGRRRRRPRPGDGGRPGPGRHRLRPEHAVTTVVPVGLADRSYEVVVGDGVRHELARVVAETVPAARRAVVVTQEGIGVEVDPGLPFEVVTVPDGESAKSLAQVEDLCRALRPVRPEPGRRGGGRRRGCGDRPGRVRRRLVPPGHGLRERGHVAAGAGGRGHRGQDRGQPPRGEEPGRRLLAAGRRAVRHRRRSPPCRRASGRRAGARSPSTRSSGIDTDLGGAPTADLPIDEQVARCAAIKAAVVAVRRARGRPADAAQLRPHPGPRPRGVGVRRRRHRPAPRRGGGRGPGLRRAAGPAPRAHRRRPGRPPPLGGGRLRPRHRAARPDATRRCCSASWAATRRPTATSPSCSTAPRRGGRPWHRPGRRGRYPGGHGVDRQECA